MRKGRVAEGIWNVVGSMMKKKMIRCPQFFHLVPRPENPPVAGAVGDCVGGVLVYSSLVETVASFVLGGLGSVHFLTTPLGFTIERVWAWRSERRTHTRSIGTLVKAKQEGDVPRFDDVVGTTVKAKQEEGEGGHKVLGVDGAVVQCASAV